MKEKNKAVFLDKDGTLIEDLPYNVNSSRVAWKGGCFDLLRMLAAEGYLLVVVTNQPGIALGYFSLEELEELQRYFQYAFKRNHVDLAGFYFCPHREGGSNVSDRLPCECRKPAAGLLLRAADELNIDLKSSWMVGDILNDVEAGNRAGCRTILINNGNETEWKPGPLRMPAYVAPDLRDAVKYILHEKRIMYPGR